MSLGNSISANYLDRAADEHGILDDESGNPSVETNATDTRLDMVKRWIKACDKHHGSQCCVPKADASIWPMWVIDVVDECIVKGDMAARYLTLSYVWGGVQTIQATTANIERLRQPGSLPRDKVVLPKTIRQAIDVTRSLGERYIWIDQLSILQDDYEHKHSQIKHMAEIYANSYITLVAATGDTADFGLVDDVDLMLNEIPLNEEKAERKATLFMDLYSAWNRRGWTFQERVFAQRMLTFFEERGVHGNMYPKSLYWVCRRTWWYDWHPAVTTRSHRSLYKAMDYRLFSRSDQEHYPDFRHYRTLCESYSSRDFTYDSDVVIAFAGAATLLEKSFRGGILYGISVLFFDIALLWSHFGFASKRTWDATHGESNRPPSWSWMSWHKGLFDVYWASAIEGILPNVERSTLAISPLVQWYFTSVGGAQVAISNEYHKYKHFAQDCRSTPPSGWSRAKSCPGRSGMHAGNVYVTRDNPRLEFLFPIPIVNSSCSEKTVSMPISNRITCNTEHAYFYLAGSKSGYDNGTSSKVIIDAEGAYSGVTILPEDLNDSCFETDMRIELIAISTGSVAVDDIWYRLIVAANRHKFGGTWEFYNVLWIEWTDGVAYRKSLGHVSKAAWEAADRELIDVILG